MHLQSAGYRTLYAGKYLNTYGTGDPLPSHVPPGWSEWFALVGNSKYWNYSMSDEGLTVSFGDVCGAGDYLTDALARRAARFIATASEPFFAWIRFGKSPVPRPCGETNPCLFLTNQLQKKTARQPRMRRFLPPCDITAQGPTCD